MNEQYSTVLRGFQSGMGNDRAVTYEQWPIVLRGSILKCRWLKMMPYAMLRRQHVETIHVLRYGSINKYGLHRSHRFLRTKGVSTPLL